MAQLAGEFGVHPNQIGRWKAELLEKLPDIFSDRRKRVDKDREETEAELYRQIGQLKVELDWLKKIAVAPVLKKRVEVGPAHPAIPVVRQCELLELAPSTFYYRPVRDERLNLELMRWLDEEYTKHPFYGSRKLVVLLRKAGYAVNRKRVQGLMRRMGLEAIYRKPRLSLPGRQHKRYPYFLKGMAVERPDMAWCADITYIRLAHGFVYLVAILDWHSRCVLAWSLSTPHEVYFGSSAALAPAAEAVA